MLYFTFWDFIAACGTVSGGLLAKFVSKLISIVPCVGLYPRVFYVPFFFLQCGSLFSDFFYEMISVFYIFEGPQGNPAVYVSLLFLGCYCLWLLSL